MIWFYLYVSQLVPSTLVAWSNFSYTRRCASSIWKQMSLQILSVVLWGGTKLVWSTITGKCELSQGGTIGNTELDLLPPLPWVCIHFPEPTLISVFSSLPGPPISLWQTLFIYHGAWPLSRHHDCRLNISDETYAPEQVPHTSWLSLSE